MFTSDFIDAQKMSVTVTAVLPDQSQNISMSFSLYLNILSP